LFRVDFAHYLICVFLLSPLPLEKLAEVDGLQSTLLRCNCNHLVKLLLILDLLVFPSLHESLSSDHARKDALLPFLIIPVLRDLSQLIKHLRPQARHLLEVLHAQPHLFLEFRVALKIFPGLRSGCQDTLRLIVGGVLINAVVEHVVHLHLLVEVLTRVHPGTFASLKLLGDALVTTVGTLLGSYRASHARSVVAPAMGLG